MWLSFIATIAMSDTTFGTYIESNPKMIGVLFTMLLLLSQAGAVAAAGVGTISGP